MKKEKKKKRTIPLEGLANPKPPPAHRPGASRPDVGEGPKNLKMLGISSTTPTRYWERKEWTYLFSSKATGAF